MVVKKKVKKVKKVSKAKVVKPQKKVASKVVQNKVKLKIVKKPKKVSKHVKEHKVEHHEVHKPVHHKPKSTIFGLLGLISALISTIFFFIVVLPFNYPLPMFNLMGLFFGLFLAFAMLGLIFSIIQNFTKRTLLAKLTTVIIGIIVLALLIITII